MPTKTWKTWKRTSECGVNGTKGSEMTDSFPAAASGQDLDSQDLDIDGDHLREECGVFGI